MTIPASDIVKVTPNVLNAGGAALDMNGLFLTTSTRPPIGSVPSFPSTLAVEDYFGADSPEAVKAGVYFNGFDNSNKKPGALLFAQYPASAVAAYVRGGNAAASLSLAQLQALNGALSLVVDGSEQSAAINLSSALSFSAAAAVIQAALNTATAATGSVAANVVVGRIDPNVGTGSIAGTTMTISAVSTGGYAPGQTVSGLGVATGTTIVEQLTGTTGSTGTYQVSVAQNVTSTTLTASGGTLTVASVTTGTLAVGQALTGSGVTALTAITALLTGTGGIGKYAVNLAQTVAPGTTITASGGTLTISAVSAGSIGIGDIFTGSGISANNTVTAFLTGTGNTGTYLCSIGDTAGSTAISIAGASVAVTFDSVSGGFIIASGTTGTVSTITYPTGSLAAPLLLTSATGAVLSQGAAAASPGSFMDGVVRVTQDWGVFETIANPDVSGFANRLAFAAWTNNQNDRYGFICSDTDASPTNTVPATGCLAFAIKAAGYSGTCLVWEPSDLNTSAFVAGTAASIDFLEENGRITFKFRSQSGITPGVTDETVANNLAANGYNYYGAYATAAQDFNFFANGVVSGDFQWFDSFINQIWLNSALQLALLNLLVQSKSIPYNTAGYTSMEAACADPINAALNFGAIREGVPLSAQQVAEVNAAAGKAIDGVLSTRGWYLQILPAPAQIRQARQSPPSKFWYMDGESIQEIDLTSIEVQ